MEFPVMHPEEHWKSGDWQTMERGKAHCSCSTYFLQTWFALIGPIEPLRWLKGDGSVYEKRFTPYVVLVK